MPLGAKTRTRRLMMEPQIPLQPGARVALFGGSFNPPHMGHSLVCHYLLETAPLDAVWLIPTYRHAFGKPLLDWTHRLALCHRLALPFHGAVSVCPIEEEREDVSYTIDTVRWLKLRHPGLHFEWVVGSDILPETPRWKEFDQLQQLVTFRIIGRTGFEQAGVLSMPEVSSTQVRAALAGGTPVEGLVPSLVLEYIRAHRLYQAPPLTPNVLHPE